MQLNAAYACRVFFNYLGIFRLFFRGEEVRPAGDYRRAFFCDLLLLAVNAGRFIGSDADGIQHRAALMINPVTCGQPRCKGVAQVVRCPVERPVLQVRREAADMYQLRGKNGGQPCAVLMHEAIKPVADAECLDGLMGANVLPCGLPGFFRGTGRFPAAQPHGTVLQAGLCGLRQGVGHGVSPAVKSATAFSGMAG
jgi:hypothetical protein